MSIYYLIFVALLVLLFFFILFRAIKFESYSFKTIKSGNDRNIEARLRLLMHKNPHSEIVVINNSTQKETKEILKKMQYDFPEIHIITY